MSEVTTPDISPAVEPVVTTEPKEPKTAKETAKESFQKEIEELVAKDQAEKAKIPPKKHKAVEEVEGKDEPEPTPKEAVKEAKKEAERLLKLKVNGEEVELSESEVIKRAQMAEGSQRKFQEAAKKQEQAVKLLEILKADPMAVLKQLGHDPEKMAEDLIWNKLQENAKTPEERQLAADIEDLKRLRAEEAERKKVMETRKKEQLKEKYQQDYINQFKETLGSSGLPVSDFTMTRLANYMSEAVKAGYTKVKPSDVVEFVKDDWKAHQQSLYSLYKDDDELMADLEQRGIVEKIRQREIAKYQKGDSSKSVEGEQPTKSSSKKTYGSVDEMLTELTRK